MSDPTEAMGARTAEMTTKNLGLIAQFLREALAEPGRIERLPDEASIVLLPEDDPALARENVALAELLVSRGEHIRLERVGVPRTDHPAWEVNQLRAIRFSRLRPRWALSADPGLLTVVYDAGRDTLRVDLFGGRREGVAVPLNPYAMLLVDLSAQESFGYLLPGFLARAVRRIPRLGQLLAVADLRPLTDEELGGADLETNERPAGEDARPRIENESDFTLMMDDLARLVA